MSSLADDLGLDCVIEGIETREQLEALPHTAHRQGFLLGRPARGEDTNLETLAINGVLERV